MFPIFLTMLDIKWTTNCSFVKTLTTIQQFSHDFSSNYVQ